MVSDDIDSENETCDDDLAVLSNFSGFQYMPMVMVPGQWILCEIGMGSHKRSFHDIYSVRI